MNKIKILFILLSFNFSSMSCQTSFDKEIWMEHNDMLEIDNPRFSMTDDLFDNYLQTGMQKSQILNLLGISLSNLENTISSDFENNIFGKNVFYIKEESISKAFFGMFYNHISLETNENDIVQSITIHFQGMIDRSFFDAFNIAYGEPQHIQIIENRQLESETYIKNKEGHVVKHLRKSVFSLREGAFEEEPLWIIWEKENFQIKAFLRYKNNMSQITFEKK